MMDRPIVTLRSISLFLLGFAAGYTMVLMQESLERIEARLAAMDFRLSHQYVPWRTATPQQEAEEDDMSLD